MSEQVKREVALEDEIAELKARLAALEPKAPPSVELPEDAFGRSYSTFALMDRLVSAANPGRMLNEGRMVSYNPGPRKAWNDGGP